MFTLARLSNRTGVRRVIVDRSHRHPMESRRRIVYTDGSSWNNIGGFGIVVLPEGKEFFGQVPEQPCTNQKAELFAVHRALMLEGDLEIRSDSIYTIKSLTEWSKVWVKNGWKTAAGKPVQHRELITAMLKQLENREVVFVHVRAHKGEPYNERADFLASQGRRFPALAETSVPSTRLSVAPGLEYPSSL